ncbi:MAG TPA: LEA type 2 family protein [Steroidobacteraceae bacterium]|nr:LEA type 2 family protein [Steroidobacteraceae bacterium]
MKRLFGAAVCALVLCLTACSSTPKVAVPKLALVSVAMTSPDIFNQQFTVRLNVENPNDQELPITGIDYKLFLEGDSFAEGLSNKPFTVPAKGDADFDMIVRTNFVSSGGRLVSRLNGRDQVQYVFEGKLLTDISGAKTIPFQESGTATLKVKR